MKARIEYIDHLKGIAILLVVIGHFIQINTIDSTGDRLFSAIYSFHMPLFMFLSGYVAVKTNSTKIIANYSDFIIKKTTSLLIPFFAWPILVDQLFFEKPEQIKFLSIIRDLILDPTIGFWFLWYLFFLSILYSIFIYVSNLVSNTPNLFRDMIIALILFILVLFVHLLGVVDYTDAFMQYFGFYFIGVFISKYERLNELIMTPKIFYILLITFIITCGQFSFNDPAFHHLNLFLVVKVIISISGIFSIYFIIRNSSMNHVVYKYLTTWGANSLVIYVTHAKMIHIFPKAYLLPSMSAFPLSLLSLLFSIPVIIACMMILDIVKLCPPLNFVLYGKK